jgi:rubrerythrin
MPAGAPRKPADPAYPKRAATRATAKNPKNTQPTTPTKDLPPYAVTDSTIGVVETPDTTPEPTEASYICNTCESPLSRADAGCPICKCSLDWRNL